MLNHRVNGQRSDEILSRFEEISVQEAPNYVIVLAGVNDIYQGIPIENVETNLLAVYRKAIAAKITTCSSYSVALQHGVTE